MKNILTNDINRKFSLIATVLLIVAFYVFENGTWGNYIVAACSVLIFFFGVLCRFRVSGRVIKPFYLYIFFFAAFCFLSTLWSWDPDESLLKARRIFLILLFLGMVYSYYEREESIDSLLNCILWGGYLSMIYAFYLYGGVGNVLEHVVNNSRLPNLEFLNVNVLGISGAITCLLQIYKIIYEKNAKSAIFMIPTFVIIAVTQSKKAILLLCIGIVLLVLFKKSSSNKRYMAGVVYIVLLLAIGYFVLSSDLFSGVSERISKMLSTIFGESSDGDISTEARLDFIKLGLKQFLETPVFGIGVGSSGALIFENYGFETYLHSNYVELLASGGLVGFSLYYSMYVYLLYNLIKYRNYDSKHSDVCIVLAILLLLMDVALVSYTFKIQYFYLMVLFIQVKNIKRKAMNG